MKVRIRKIVLAIIIMVTNRNRYRNKEVSKKLGLSVSLLYPR